MGAKVKTVEYAPGMRVLVRDEEWIVKKVEQNPMGGAALHCIGVTPLVKDRSAIFLTALDEARPVDPAAVQLTVDTSPAYRRTLLYLESQWRQRIPTDAAIHIGHHAAMDQLPYQLAPAALALGELRPRILIADVVGLGKTLEAGILMSELILRGKGKRILVVTGKSMMAQFQKELWNRFTIPLIALDSAKIRQIRAELPANYNPFFTYDKTIISIDTLKNDIAYRTHLEHATWDIIVIDEAQNVATRGRASQRSRLARLLADRSDAMILLSATPHDGRAESFASLMNMLDPTAIADPHNYTADDIHGLFIRRDKNDVRDEMQDRVPERRVTKETMTATAVEERAYDILTQLHLAMDDARGGGQQLFTTSLEKALFSSPVACAETIAHRLKKLDRLAADPKTSKERRAAAQNDSAILRPLATAVAAITPAAFSRYQHLLALLKSSVYGWNPKAKDDRVVIFTERVATMTFLAEHLARDLELKPDAIAQISGSMSDEDQQAVVEQFGRREASVRLLVASDVASEGLNLHYLCHRLIHFDIPWSLMTFQQRNGRIDRYGQHARPDIRYFVTQTANAKIRGDLRILEILVEKEEQAQKNIGDATMLLGKYSVEAEEQTVAEAIEQGKDAGDLASTLDLALTGDDLMDLLATEAPPETAAPQDEQTLFSDTAYLRAAFDEFQEEQSADAEPYRVQRLDGRPGLAIRLTDDLRRRLMATLPRPLVNVLAQHENLRFYTEAADVMAAVRAAQESKTESDWTDVQYLWRMHPIFDWVDDRAGLLCRHDEAPLALVCALPRHTTMYLVNGSIPNRRSTPLVDEWFGVLCEGGACVKILPMREALAACGIHAGAKLPNGVDQERYVENIQAEAQANLPDAVHAATDYLTTRYEDYRQRTDPQIAEALARLEKLRGRRKDYEMNIFENQSARRRTEKLHEIDRLFDRFVAWVRDTMTIENHPYLRVIAVVTGRTDA